MPSLAETLHKDTPVDMPSASVRESVQRIAAGHSPCPMHSAAWGLLVRMQEARALPAHCCGRRFDLPLQQSRWTVQAYLQVVLKQLHGDGSIITAAPIQAGEQAASLWLGHACPAGLQARRAACRGSMLLVGLQSSYQQGQHCQGNWTAELTSSCQPPVKPRSCRRR